MSTLFEKEASHPTEKSRTLGETLIANNTKITA